MQKLFVAHLFDCKDEDFFIEKLLTLNQELNNFNSQKVATTK
jgi:hypothetical protein